MEITVTNYRLILAGGFLLIFFMGVFWYAMLRRLEVVLKERLKSTRSQQVISGFRGMLGFILGGQFKQTGDDRLIGVCKRLRQLLFGYLGLIGAYIVFLVKCHPI